MVTVQRSWASGVSLLLPQRPVVAARNSRDLLVILAIAWLAESRFRLQPDCLKTVGQE